MSYMAQAGSSGPTAASERQFYSRRKTLINEIRRLAAAIRAPPDEEAYNRVVLQLEDERKRARASLSKVIEQQLEGLIVDLDTCIRYT